MRLLKKLFGKREAENNLRPMPSWNEIVDTMFDKCLDGRGDEIAQVIYNSDRTKRVLILKSSHGYYKYCFEYLGAYDDEEWMFIGRDPGALPAMWIPLNDRSISLFASAQEAVEAIKTVPEYASYLDN